MLLPPLPVMRPVLPPVPKPLPPLPARIGLPPIAPIERPNVHGDAALGYVQIILDSPNDAAARALFISCGVKMAGAGLMPADGVLTAHKQPSKAGYVYRWRC